MKYPTIDAQLFIDNRKRFTDLMEPGSIAIFHSNYQYSWNGDAFHKFKQNSDLFWLCGIDQEDTVLVLFPDCPVKEYQQCLFLLETNEHIAIWEGHKYTKEEATTASGIANIFWNDNYLERLRSIINMADNIYLPLNENDRYPFKSPYRNLDMAHQIQQAFPLHNYKRAGKMLQRLRSVKHPLEVDLTREAVAISKKGWERILRSTKPGMMEYEIEADLIHEFIRNRGNGFSFEPIVASGANACVLHCIENKGPVQDGDLILVDCGVDYANYASDMTRCLPANGRFSKRQKDVYNAVLRVMYGARELLKPGTMLMEYHTVVGGMMEKELVDLGLITMDDIKNQDPSWPAYKKYFMHGTSHFLGIDVHDSGMRYEPMQAGNLFTCEPGIYIQEEGIGVRIENNILIQENGYIDLMDEVNMPIEVEEIEAIMNA
ncbi:MAG: aminopeptidase P N-terminal domain-containing protein [Flavobacteriales bacterium]|nr:aminopeptidase P N-terminal domain-containing protein [Flavobacteriales bacterium]